MARVGCFPLPTAASPPAHHTRLGKGEEAGTGSAQQRQGCGRPLGPPSPSSVPPGSPRLAVSPLSSLLLICVFKMYLQTHAASPAQPPSLPARVSGNRAKCVHKSSGKHTLLALPRQRHLGCPVSMRGCWVSFHFPIFACTRGAVHSLAGCWAMLSDRRPDISVFVSLCQAGNGLCN